MAKHDRILGLNALLDRSRLSRATLYRKVGAGSYPRPIRIAYRRTAWREFAIRARLADP